MTESIRDIRIFVAAYEERSFTAAAVREHATQSGVSQHIRKLEEGFGVKFFNREKGQVAPTPAAHAYYGRCIQILRNIELSNDAMRAFTGIAGDVFVGLMPTMTRATLAPAIQRVVSEHPNMKIHVTESLQPDSYTKGDGGGTGFCCGAPSDGQPWIKGTALLAHVGGVGHNPNKKQHLRRTRLRDVGPLKIVLPSHANPRRKPLETYFTTNGIEIERLVEMDALMGTLDLVANSDWVTIVPALMMTAEIERMHFSVVPLVDPTAPLDLIVIEPMRRTLSTAARAFLEILREEAVSLNNRWRPYFE